MLSKIEEWCETGVFVVAVDFDGEVYRLLVHFLTSASVASWEKR